MVSAAGRRDDPAHKATNFSPLEAVSFPFAELFGNLAVVGVKRRLPCNKPVVMVAIGVVIHVLHPETFELLANGRIKGPIQSTSVDNGVAT